MASKNAQRVLLHWLNTSWFVSESAPPNLVNDEWQPRWTSNIKCQSPPAALPPSLGLPPFQSWCLTPSGCLVLGGAKLWEPTALPPGFVFLPRLASVWSTEVFSKIRKGDLRIPGDLLQMEMESLRKELSLLNLDFPCLNLKHTCASQLPLALGGRWSKNRKSWHNRVNMTFDGVFQTDWWTWFCSW